LVAVPIRRVASLRSLVMRLAAEGIADRVEADPQL
jgi:hypothetical protein